MADPNIYGADFGKSFDRMFLYVVKQLLIGGLEHLDYFSIQLGISSSQLTNSIIFSEGRYATNQSILPTKFMI